MYVDEEEHSYEVTIDMNAVFTLAEVIHALRIEMEQPPNKNKMFVYDLAISLLGNALEEEEYIERSHKVPEMKDVPARDENGYYQVGNVLWGSSKYGGSIFTNLIDIPAQTRWWLTVYLDDISTNVIADHPIRGVTIEMIGAAIQSACRHYLTIDTDVRTKRTM